MVDYVDLSDTQLLKLLREDDDQAFEVLYERHWGRVFEQAFIRVRQHDIAENITQDIFVEIWRNRSYSQIDNFPAYLYVSVKNRVLKWFKKEKRYIPIATLLAEVRAASEYSDHPLLEKEFIQVYEALLQTLSPTQQMIYRLRFEEELSTADIATQLQMNRKTVQNQLSLALAQLRSSLALVWLFSQFYSH